MKHIQKRFSKEDLPFIGSFIIGAIISLLLIMIALAFYKGFTEPFSYYAFAGLLFIIFILEWIISKVGSHWQTQTFFKQALEQLIVAIISSSLLIAAFHLTHTLQEYVFLPPWLPLGLIMCGSFFIVFLARAVYVGKEEFIV